MTECTPLVLTASNYHTSNEYTRTIFADTLMWAVMNHDVSKKRLNAKCHDDLHDSLTHVSHLHKSVDFRFLELATNTPGSQVLKSTTGTKSSFSPKSPTNKTWP